MTTFRRLLAALTMAVLAPQAIAQAAFPNRPVRIVVPFSVGTAADIAARTLATRLAEVWGQGVVVENVAGAAGNIGAATVARAAPDGHTLAMLGINHVINPSLYKDVQYDIPRDFRPIVKVGVAPLALVVHPAFPARTLADLVAQARARPGGIDYGSGGSGSITHLSIELLMQQAGIRMTHVPYKSIAPMLTDILGNQVPFGSPAVASVAQHARAGSLRVLAVTSAKRASALPDVPTVAESGFPGFDVSAWNGLVAPARTPDTIVERIHADAARIVQSREFAEAMHKQAMDVDLMDPVAFGAFLAAELDKWSRLVRATGAKVE